MNNMGQTLLNRVFEDALERETLKILSGYKDGKYTPFRVISTYEQYKEYLKLNETC